MSAGGLRPRVGIVGGGQLARMTYDASLSLGVDIAVLAQPGDEATTGHVPDVILATTLDLAVLDEFASRTHIAPRPATMARSIGWPPT